MRVAIVSPVRRDSRTLAVFLAGLDALQTDGLDVRRILADDNDDPTSSSFLRAWPGCEVLPVHARPHPEYVIDDKAHRWSLEAVWRAAALKDRLMRVALSTSADWILVVDSDVILQPPTLRHLVGLDLDVVAEVFWTDWRQNGARRPQVWHAQPYVQFPVYRGESVAEGEQAEARVLEWFRWLQEPRTVPVGGLGACTLFRAATVRRIFEQSGSVWGPIDSLHHWGEDRHMCLRCAVLGIQRWADTHYPAYHCYRQAELDAWPAWWAEVTRSRAES